MFGGGTFMELTKEPASFTVGPRGFYWLLLKTPVTEIGETSQEPLATSTLSGRWSPELLVFLEDELLPKYLPTCRWFGHKLRTLRDVKIAHTLIDPKQEDGMRIFVLELNFTEGDSANQILPLCLAGAEQGDSLGTPAALAQFADERVLWDALYLPACRHRFWEIITGQEKWGKTGSSLFGVSPTLRPSDILPATKLLGGEQSNTNIAFDETHLLKFLRKFEPGPHPDADILRALGEKEFANVPRYEGEIRYRINGAEGVLALLTNFVPNEGDGWIYTLDSISHYFEHVLSALAHSPGEVEVDHLPDGAFRERLRQLGERTGTLHTTLAELTEKPDFAPEPYTTMHQRSLYQSLRTLLRRTETEVTKRLDHLDPPTRQQALNWLSSIPQVMGVYGELLHRKISTNKIRIHGDYHLGQVLNTGNDFVILDFEGEPRRSLGERILKRSSLVDVAGMLRSFDYAIEASLLRQRKEDVERLRPWAERWLALATDAFLTGYRSSASGSFLPHSDEDFAYLLKVFLLDKAIYEIGYEMNFRPAFLPIPIGAVNRILQATV
jgi:maltose alpha-D-glucosyltransferase/alpha-amylase